MQQLKPPLFRENGQLTQSKTSRAEKIFKFQSSPVSPKERPFIFLIARLIEFVWLFYKSGS